MHDVAWLTNTDNVAALPSTSVQADSESALYPVSNLKDHRVTKIWRSEQGTTLVKLMIISADEADATLLGLGATNLSSDATVTIDAGADLTVGDLTGVAMTWREFTQWKYWSAPESHRYWLITIDDPGSRQGFIEIGYLALGTLTEPGFNMATRWSSAIDITNARVRTEFGHPNVEPMYEAQRLELRFGPLPDDSDMAVIRGAYRSLTADYRPAFLLPDREGTEGYVGRFASTFQETRDESGFSVIVRFSEDPGSTRIAADPLIYESGVHDLDALGAVFSRSGAAFYVDRALALRSAADGIVRDRHFDRAWNGRGVRSALLVESAATNEANDSEDFTAWPQANVVVNANQAVAPDDNMTADEILDNDTTTDGYYVINDSAVGIGSSEPVAVSVHLKANGIGFAALVLHEDSGFANRVMAFVDMSTLDIAATDVNGTGTYIGSRVHKRDDGWARISLSGTVSSMATNIRFRLYLTDSSSNLNHTGTGAPGDGLYAWGAMIQVGASAASSYAASARSDEDLYIPFSPAPQPMTFYVHATELGAVLTTEFRILSVTAAGGSAPSLVIRTTASNRYRIAHNNGSGAVVSDPAATPDLLAEFEFRGELYRDGAVRGHISIEGASEVSGAKSGANALTAAWSGPRLYLNSDGGTLDWASAIHAVKAFYGLQSIETCREARSDINLL